MKNFIQWAEDKNLDLASIVERPEAEEPKTEGSTKRAGVRSHAYPDLYSRGQYPKEYMRPTAADAVTYQDKE